jgi:hypothetical protein
MDCILYGLMHCPEAEALLKGAEAGATAAASGQLSNSCCQLSASATAAASGQLSNTHTLHLQIQYVYVRRS